MWTDSDILRDTTSRENAARAADLRCGLGLCTRPRRMQPCFPVPQLSSHCSVPAVPATLSLVPCIRVEVELLAITPTTVYSQAHRRDLRVHDLQEVHARIPAQRGDQGHTLGLHPGHLPQRGLHAEPHAPHAAGHHGESRFLRACGMHACRCLCAQAHSAGRTACGSACGDVHAWCMPRNKFESQTYAACRVCAPLLIRHVYLPPMPPP